MKKRVLAGIRATGTLHLGNYLGAVKGMLELQNDPSYETLYMVADVHTLTTPFDVEELRANRREVVIDYLAAGLDPEKSILFFQADVPEHTELAFYLSSVVSIARMQHLPTFKDKVKQYPHHATMALLNYPILMAADILAYKAGFVPAGLDQEPHLEVAREIARKMNDQYGMDFLIPKRHDTKGEYIPSLTGLGKMSKSVGGSYINLTDGLETIQSKLAKVPTDKGIGLFEQNNKAVSVELKNVGPVTYKKGLAKYVYFEEGDKNRESFGVATLMELVELYLGKEGLKKYQELYSDPKKGIRYQELKESLAQAIYKELEPMQKQRAQLAADKKYVDNVIADGAKRARAIAYQTVDEVKVRMGLG